MSNVPMFQCSYAQMLKLVNVHMFKFFNFKCLNVIIIKQQRLLLRGEEGVAAAAGVAEEVREEGGQLPLLVSHWTVCHSCRYILI